MSSIQITDRLMRDLQQLLNEHDPQTRNLGVGIQYLAAIEGLLLAQLPGPAEDKRRLFAQLVEFSRQVLEDNLGDQAAPEPPAANDSGDPAFGIWRPDGNEGEGRH